MGEALEKLKDGETLPPLPPKQVAKSAAVATSALRFYAEQRLLHARATIRPHGGYPRAVIRGSRSS